MAKSTTSAKAAGSKQDKARASNAKVASAPGKSATKTRNRRNPAQMLADLKAERQLIAEKMGSRLAKLDARIAKVEARYDTQIRLAELTTGATLDDLQLQLDEAKRQQKLLRMALKAKR